MPNCIELNSCNWSDPLSVLTLPYTTAIGDFAIPIIWGVALGLIYVKTENAMLVAVLGFGVMAGLYQYSPSLFQTSADSSIFFWAISMVSVAIGCTMFYLFKHRIQSP